MSMLRRLASRWATSVPTDAAASGTDAPERYRISGEVPGLAGRPAARISVDVIREPHQDGERVRVSAHLQANLASVIRPVLQQASSTQAAPAAALAAPSPEGASAIGRLADTGALVSRTAGRMLQQTLSRPWVQRVAEPLLRYDVNSWVHVQASTASLDAGSTALLPDAEALAPLGIRPGQAPLTRNLEVWSHGDARSNADLSILRLDKRDLPKELQASLGEQPFQMVATVATTREQV